MIGVLNILKPPGMTSHDVVDFVRRLYDVKAGHTGTLDPGAAGVLPVCIGKATRLVDFFPSDKEYRVEITFGIATSTQDGFGEVVEERDASGLSIAQVESALQGFVGVVEQIPPMTSAVRHKGRRLYELARRGMVVERKPRQVKIFFARIVHACGLGTPRPKVVFDLGCSAGTYVRTLCADLGEKLGVGAYMSFLLRTRAGVFDLERSHTIEELSEKRLESMLVPVDEVLRHLPAIDVGGRTLKAVRNGNSIKVPRLNLNEGEVVRLCGPEGLLALAEVRRDVKGGDLYIKPIKVLV